MQKKTRAKKILSIFFTMIGLCMLFYPWISDFVNQRQADSIVNAYDEEVSHAPEEEKKRLLKEAREYNMTLLDGQVKLTEPFEESMIDTSPYVYEEMLSLNGADVMGKVDIPKINVSLPIYHGTSMSVLKKGVGHLKGSSLPVGGKNTHSVLTGHSGLSNAKLFTDLTELKKGDIFIIKVLGKKLAYKVADIYVVLPDDTDKLMVIEGRDLCTLVTCTPYGVNSHRLLVRGERTKYRKEAVRRTQKINPAKSLWMRSYAIAVGIGLAIVFMISAISYLIKRRKKNAKNNETVKNSHIDPPDINGDNLPGGTQGK